MTCQMPKCPNKDKDMRTITVNIGDDAGAVLREACADCLTES